MEEFAPLAEPVTNIGNMEEGGSKAVSTTEELAPLVEPATNIALWRKEGPNQCQLWRNWHF
eukprot:12384683-Ditylum_brightwellii.AAC.1